MELLQGEIKNKYIKINKILYYREGQLSFYLDLKKALEVAIFF